MKNLLKVFGVIAFVAVIGFSFAACGNGTTSGSGGGNSGLNGTWVSGEARITLSGNSFTQYYGSTPASRGTFTTSGSNITMTITAIHGDYLASEGLSLDSRWYSRADFQAMGIPAAYLDQIFMTVTLTYTLNGDTLIVDGEAYTRQ